MITPDQALAGLGAIVGGGGLSAVVVAVMGFLTEARKGRKPSDGAVSIAIGEGLAISRWDEAAVAHLGTIAYAISKMVAISEINAEETIQDKSFHDRLENKVIRIMADAIRDALSGPKA